MNLRSLVNVKRITASMRSNGSSESLILDKVKHVVRALGADIREPVLRSEHVWAIEIMPILQVGNGF
jgi:hypothetical protein